MSRSFNICCLVQIDICIDDCTLRNVTLRLTLRPGAKCHTFRTYKKRIQIFAFGAAKAAWACSYDRICEFFRTRTAGRRLHPSQNRRYVLWRFSKQTRYYAEIGFETNSNDQCWQIRTKTPWVRKWQIEIFIRKRWLRQRQSTRSAKYWGGLFLAQPPFERRPAGSPASLLTFEQPILFHHFSSHSLDSWLAS